MKQRIIGLDVARALAVIGMVIVNFKVVLGSHDPEGYLSAFTGLFEGKAAATFVVLAGIGLALMTRPRENDDAVRLARARRQIVVRAVLLFLLGTSYVVIWPADILHFYGVYMLLTLLFLRAHGRWIGLAILLLVLSYPLLLTACPYETGWDFETLSYLDFWTPAGFFRNLFINGFHPVFPWAAFMLFGYWLGRQPLGKARYVRRILMLSGSVFLLVQGVSYGLRQGLSEEPPLHLFLSTHPMPPFPLYMLNGMAVATLMIAGCILLAARFEGQGWIRVFQQTGQLALTCYVAHVLLGMGAMEVFSSIPLGAYSLGFSVAYALVFSALCMLFAVVWLRFYKQGPLEWGLRKLTRIIC